MSHPQSHPAESSSRTATVAPTPAPEHSDDTNPPIGTLRLRGGPVRRQRVMWSAGTVDNEGMGKKKSKICCIYHRPKAFDESSSESSESSTEDRGEHKTKGHHKKGKGKETEESESDGGGGDGSARPSKMPRRRKHHHDHRCSKEPKANKYDRQDKSDGGKAKDKT